jgi:hypothetical protein
MLWLSGKQAHCLTNVEQIRSARIVLNSAALQSENLGILLGGSARREGSFTGKSKVSLLLVNVINSKEPAVEFRASVGEMKFYPPGHLTETEF